MHVLALVATSSALLASVSAVGIQVCYSSGFANCETLVGGSGQCLFVNPQYNDHVYSARANSDTRSCDSYDNINNGACADLLVSGIDSAGYSGLPNGDATSGFVCYA